MDVITILIVLAVAIVVCVAIGLVYVMMNKSLQQMQERMETIGAPEFDSTGLSLIQNDIKKVHDDMRSLDKGIHQEVGDLSHRIEKRIERSNKEVYTLREKIDGKMDVTNKDINKSLMASSKTIEALRQDLGKVTAAQDQIKGLDSSINKIQNIFSAPQARGGFGEFTLEAILDDVLPDQWDDQYYFPDGQHVDFIVNVRDKIVPIDSKFPLDKYEQWIEAPEEERDVKRKELNAAIKNNIKSISEKYVRPEENTMEFALMYVPSNKMYYDIFLHEECSRDPDVDRIFNLSNDKKVFPISPGNLFTYLHSISLGLKGMKVEENAQEIIKRLENVRKKFEAFSDEYGRVSTKIDEARKKYDSSEDRFRKLDDEIGRVLRLKEEE